MRKRGTELYGIIGLGRFGFALAKALADSGRDVMVVDCNSDKIKDATSFTDLAFQVATPTKEVMHEIGIQNCDVVIICIGEKLDTSILTTLNVIDMGVKRVIAKAISKEQGSVLEKLGAEVVYPERDMAIRLAQRLVTPKIMEYITLSEDIEVSEIKLTTKITGNSIINLDIRGRFGLNILAIKKDEDIIIDIEPTLLLEENNIMVVIGKKENIRKFEAWLY